MKRSLIILITVFMLLMTGCKKETEKEIVPQQFSDGLIYITLDSSFQEVNVMGPDYTLKNDEVTVIAHTYGKDQLADIGYGKLDLNSFVSELISGDEVEEIETGDNYKRFSYYAVYENEPSYITIAAFESENYLVSVTIVCKEKDRNTLQSKIDEWITSTYLKEEQA